MSLSTKPDAAAEIALVGLLRDTVSRLSEVCWQAEDILREERHGVLRVPEATRDRAISNAMSTLLKLGPIMNELHAMGITPAPAEGILAAYNAAGIDKVSQVLRHARAH